MSKPSHALWRSEQVTPVPVDRRHDRTTDPFQMLGFWMIDGARTKPAWPVAIWMNDGKDSAFWQIGTILKNTTADADEFAEFTQSSWLKCVAVSESDWHTAINDGYWPLAEGETERRPARNFTDAERLDIIPDTPASSGGNMAGEDQFHAQVVSKIEALADEAKAIGTIDTLAKANAAAAILDPMRALYKQGEMRRKEEVAPIDEARAKVQAKWSALGIAEAWGKTLVNSIQKFRDNEKAKLEALERERQAAERKRIAEETRVRLEAEAAELQRLAESMQMELEPQPTAEDIAAEAEQVAAEQVAEQAASAPPIEAPRVGTAHGRAISKPRLKTATIIDMRALAEHFIHAGDEDFASYMGKRADAAARAKITLPGTKIDE